MKFLLPLNVPDRFHAIKFAVVAIVEPLHTLLKDIFRNLSTQTEVWVFLKRQLK